MFEVDPLKLYRGSDIQITDKIYVVNPTIDEISEFGEERYFQSIHTICASGADLKWQLWDKGIDYTKIDDYDLFVKFTSISLCNRAKEIKKYANTEDVTIPFDLEENDYNPLQLTLKTSSGNPLDLSDFDEYVDSSIEDNVLYNKLDDITIDRFVFRNIVDAVRKIHFLKRNNEIPGNKTTKMILIEDAREEALSNKDKPFESIIVPMVSSLSVKSGQCGSDTIWNMNIYQLLENIRRVFKMQDADTLMKAAYSGFANLKNVDKERFNWLSPIN